MNAPVTTPAQPTWGDVLQIALEHPEETMTSLGLFAKVLAWLAENLLLPIVQGVEDLLRLAAAILRCFGDALVVEPSPA